MGLFIESDLELWSWIGRNDADHLH